MQILHTRKCPMPWGCKNRPAPFPGRMSCKATKPGSVVSYLSMLYIVLTAKPILAVLCYYSKTGFWPWNYQISTDLAKILHTPIVVWNTLMGLLDHDRRVGGSRPNQNDYVFFVILLMHPKSYIETMDQRNLGSKLSKWR